ncbi:MAG: tRNA pseudouridine(38-40) synthase TruA [Chthoniobacteraceae bacterium]|jgi:tRNA pseudouridine38-40 synthase
MRLRLLIAYDGANFHGWQSQSAGNTIQDCLEQSFATLCGQRIPVHGAGRTDAGVHALAQCAHADVPPEKKIDWTPALNANLPREIRVLRSTRARPGFHARYSARGKIYLYRIWNAPILSPFELRRAWHLPAPLDLDSMRRAARAFEGKHDFKSFAANRGKPDQDTVRTIFSLQIRKKGPLVTLKFHGDGFLYKMVRLMTGALVRTAQARAPAESISAYLNGGPKCHFAAPAEGLYLARVIY